MKDKIFNTFFITLFVIFITMYLINNNGYSEYKNSMGVALTKKEIEKFEEDIASGIDIALEDYSKKEVNYNNKISIASSKFSEVTSSYVKGCIKLVIDTLGKLFS